MAERSSQQAQQAREELRRVVGFSAADEIEKLDRLKKAGSITDADSCVFAPNSFNSVHKAKDLLRLATRPRPTGWFAPSS